MNHRRTLLTLALVLTVAVAACAKKPTPIPRPAPPPPSTGAIPPPPPQAVNEPIPVPPEPLAEDALGSKPLDDLNRDSPLKPVFFLLDSAELLGDAQAILQQNAGVLKKYATWQITIEGHCDERGSAEYNLALGERRALAARDYIVSLGIGANRVRTVSYGKEFPFDAGHDEDAYKVNRRAHFMVTAK